MVPLYNCSSSLGRMRRNFRFEGGKVDGLTEGLWNMNSTWLASLATCCALVVGAVESPPSVAPRLVEVTCLCN